MKKFNFYQDIMVSVWQRQYFTIEADNEQEAMKQIMEYRNEDVSKGIMVDSNEYLTETELLIKPENNGGKATIELYKRGEQTPFATNIDDNEKDFDEKKTAHQIAYGIMAGYTIEATDDEKEGLYNAYHAAGKLNIIVLFKDGTVKHYIFDESWDELVNNNEKFRKKMKEELIKRDKWIMPFVHDWLAGHLTEMKPKDDYADYSVPFSIYDVVNVWEHQVSIKEIQPAELIGYQIVGEEDSLPEGLYSSQIIRDKKTAFLILAKARCEEPDKGYQIYPIYEGEIEEPQFI